MSKKTFSTAPKPQPPSEEQIAAFERGGVGHDSKSPTPKIVESEPTKRLSIDLPASVHMRFKTACSATGNKMVVEIQDFIEKRTKELENEAGIIRK